MPEETDILTMSSHSHFLPTLFLVIYVIYPIFIVNLLFLDCLDTKVEVVSYSEMSVTVCCLTQCYIPKKTWIFMDTAVGISDSLFIMDTEKGN